jgi:hemerythrin-like domain-containing protein
MKITNRLIGDHLTFRRMLRDLDVLADQSAGQRDIGRLIRIVELFKDHMMLHAWCEDVFYYPVVREALPRATPPLTVAYMDHLDQEHQSVDGYLERLENEVKLQPPSVTWPQTYALFAKGLQAHMKKEEEELFPLSEALLGAARLEEISQELERRRREAPAVRIHAQENR